MTSSTPPRARPIVLVHGAWHGAWCWAPLQAALDGRGLASYAIDLPGHGASALPLGDLHGDADHVTSVLDHLALADVVLVGHSYGGAVVTDAAGRRADIAHVVMVAAFALLDGESVMDPLAALPPEQPALTRCMQAHDDETFSIDPAGAVEAFYGCCPPAVAAAAVARLDRQPTVTFTQPVRAGVSHLPSTYVRCLRDEAIHPRHQTALAARCTTRVDLDTDHSPFASTPEELADIVEAAARSGDDAGP